MSIVSCQPVGYRSITRTGFHLALASFSPSRYSGLPLNQSLLRAPFYLFPATILPFCTSRTRSLNLLPSGTPHSRTSKAPSTPFNLHNAASSARERTMIRKVGLSAVFCH
jgi:hypothetical protein